MSLFKFQYQLADGFKGYDEAKNIFDAMVKLRKVYEVPKHVSLPAIINWK